MSCPASPSKPTSSIRKQILPVVASSIFRPRSLKVSASDGAQQRSWLHLTLENKLVAFGPHEKMDTERKWLKNK